MFKSKSSKYIISERTKTKVDFVNVQSFVVFRNGVKKIVIFWVEFYFVASKKNDCVLLGKLSGQN